MTDREDNPAVEQPSATLRKPWSTPAIFAVRDVADTDVKGGNVGDYTTYGTPEGS